MTTMTTDPLAWTREGLCRGSVLVFFPDDFEAPDPRALRLCQRCPKREVCLQWALDHEEWGIWGGTTEADRSKILKARHRVKCPDCRSLEVIDQGDSEVCLSCGLSWPI